MDIVVYIGSGENEELRYAIRTWCKNLKFRNLYVVGGPKPSWLNPDIYVENPTRKAKMLQCYDNVKIAMADDRLSDDVLLLMDDVFVMHEIGDWEYNFNRGFMIEQYNRSVERHGHNPYDEQILYTNDVLHSVTPMPLSFEAHAPFKCNRKLMLQVLDSMEGKIIDHLLCRSIYGNTFPSASIFKTDVKIHHSSDEINKSDLVISTGDQAFSGNVGKTIKQLFPTPSRYEK